MPGKFQEKPVNSLIRLEKMETVAKFLNALFENCPLKTSLALGKPWVPNRNFCRPKLKVL